MKTNLSLPLLLTITLAHAALAKKEVRIFTTKGGGSGRVVSYGGPKSKGVIVYANGVKQYVNIKEKKRK